MFNLLNKQSFFNEWSFVIGLIVLGLASMVVEQRPLAAAGAGDTGWPTGVDSLQRPAA